MTTTKTPCPAPKLRFKDDRGQDYPEWRSTTIGKEGYFYYGKSAPKWSVTEDATTPCVRYGELYTKHQYQVKQIYSYTNIPIEKLKLSKGGEVLVPRVGEEPLDFCKCAFLPFANIAIGEMISVYNTQNNPLFISYLFNGTMKYEFAKRVEGGNVSNLYYYHLENITMHVPCLEEQRKIADFLSTFDEKVEAKEQQLAALQDIKKGLLQQIFSQQLRFKDDHGLDYPEWDNRTIGSFATCFAGATPSTKHDEYWLDGSIPWMASGEVNFGLIFKTEKMITKLGFSKCSTKMVKPNTVVIALAGQGKTRGQVALTKIPLCTNQSLAAIEVDSSVDSVFLYQFLKNQYEQLRKISSGDGGRGGLNLSLINGFYIKVPCLEEQRKIADFLSAFDEKIEAVQAQLKALKDIKKGLLQQLFV